MTRKFFAIALLTGAMTLQACSGEQIADNTVDATVFVGKTAVKGAVGAGKLAVKGGKVANKSIKARNSKFPPGSAVCIDAEGQQYLAPVNDAGVSFCPVSKT